MTKWDKRFLNLAKHIAEWSYDPSTKVGCVIVNAKRRIVSTGYNGFPQAISDIEELYKDREEKYRRVLHAEQNALIFAQRPVEGCTLYVYPLPPCHRCALEIIQHGVSRVVFKTPPHDRPDLLDSFELSIKLFEEAGIEIKEYS